MSIHFLESIGRSSSPKESEISLIVLEGFLASSLFLICTPVTLSTIGFLIAKYFTSMTIKVSEILLLSLFLVVHFRQLFVTRQTMSFLFILSCYTFDNCPSFPKYQIAEINIFKNKNFLLRSNFVRCLNVSNLKKSNLKVERNFCVRIRRLLHTFERTVIRLTKSNPISNKRPS